MEHKLTDFEAKATTVFGTGARLRCAWEVRAGLVPGHPVAEYTRRFLVTSDSYYAELEMTDEQFKAAYPDGNGLFKQAQMAATEYYLSLQNPNAFNWVDINWIYF